MWAFLSLAEFNLNWHFNLFPIWSFVLIIVSRKLLTKNLILLEDKKSMARLAFIVCVPVWLVRIARCKSSLCQQFLMNCRWTGSDAAGLAKSFSLL